MRSLLFTVVLLCLGSALLAQAPDVESVQICRESELIYKDYSEAVVLNDDKIVFGGRGNYMGPDLVSPMIEVVGVDGKTISLDFLESPHFRPIVDLAATSDGGYVYAADYREDADFEDQIEITKIKADGEVQWAHRYSGDSSAVVRGIEQTEAGGYIVTGYVLEGIRSKSFLLALDSQGDSLWMQTYSIPDKYVGGFDVCETVDGEFLVAGLYNFSELLVLKYNASGDFLWAEHFDEFQAGQWNLEIVKTANGEFCIGANTALAGGITPIMLMRMQSNGDTLWTREYQEAGNLWLGGICPTVDNGVLLAGSYSNDEPVKVYLAKADDAGELEWSGKYYYVMGEPMPLAVREGDNGAILVTGYTNIDHLGVETFLLKFEGIATGIDIDGGTVLPAQVSLSQSYPNPFNAGTTITYSLPNRAFVSIEIFNVLGQRVNSLVNAEQPIGKYSVNWDGTDETGNEVATGVYFYRLSIDNIAETKKMMLLK